MKSKRARLGLGLMLCAALAFAGCLGDEGASIDGLDQDAAGEDEQANQEDPLPELRTYEHQGTITVEAWHMGLPFLVDDTELGFSFRVPGNADTILAELQWSGEAGQLNLNVHSPKHCPYSLVGEPVESVSCNAGYWATGESEHAYRAEGEPVPSSSGQLALEVPEDEIQKAACEDVCDWRAYVDATVAADVEFEVRLTVVHEGELPSGYSAFP